MQKKEETKKKKPIQRINWEKKITEESFPPCIKLILSGLSDGRKRSIFTLTNFLKMMNWSQQEIEEKITEWNSRNKPSLPRSIVIGQLRWSQGNQRNPANCSSDMFYKSIGICKPDEICRKGKMIKNPINYPFRKLRPRFQKYNKSYEYKCSICKKGFKSMSSLNIHRARSHGQYN